MKFVSIEMNNWLVFRGRQEVIFPQDEHANILLIFDKSNEDNGISILVSFFNTLVTK